MLDTEKKEKKEIEAEEEEEVEGSGQEKVNNLQTFVGIYVFCQCKLTFYSLNISPPPPYTLDIPSVIYTWMSQIIWN